MQCPWRYLNSSLSRGFQTSSIFENLFNLLKDLCCSKWHLQTSCLSWRPLVGLISILSLYWAKDHGKSRHNIGHVDTNQITLVCKPFQAYESTERNLGSSQGISIFNWCIIISNGLSNLSGSRLVTQQWSSGFNPQSNLVIISVRRHYCIFNQAQRRMRASEKQENSSGGPGA